MYLQSSEHFLNENNGSDLYFILLEILNQNLMQYIDILDFCSKGESLSDMRGSYILLDMDWEESEDFGFIQCYVCEQEGIKMTINEFLSSIKYISEKYVIEHPLESKKVQKYLDKIESRYTNFLN